MPRRLGRLASAVLAVLLLVACTSNGSTPAPSGTSSPTGRVAGWRADLAGLIPRVAALHPDLADAVPAALTAEVSHLEQQVPSLNDDQLMAGVMRLTTHLAVHGRDGHTGLFVWGQGNRAVHSLPLRLWFFSDGLYVESQLAGTDLIGSRIVGIGGHPLDAVMRRIDPLIPRDNASTVLLLRPRFLLVPELLHGVGLVAGVGPEEVVDEVPLDVVDRDGRHRSVDVAPVPIARYNRWAGFYGLHLVPRPGVGYLTHIDDVLWHAVLRRERTLYVGYNRVELLDFDEVEAIRRLARSPGIDKVVVDVRHNYGGETDEDEPLLDVLADPRVGRPGRLYLLTGRNTFSAASLFAAKLVRRTPVIVVGEPMGGAPTAYGNSVDVTLHHSGLVVSVSTTRAVGVSAHDRRTTIVPDVAVSLSSGDYFAGRDPVLQAALDDGR
ncbi:MAG: hypothetical protein QOJ03_2217 [Frankiaceae bacterium]|nr:hypothetical protein [Frankiaceae bacterium]